MLHLDHFTLGLVLVSQLSKWPLNLKNFPSKGFICEGCRDQTLIFPFQFSEVDQCPKCFACYHKGCSMVPCSKCQRQKKRNTTTIYSNNLNYQL